LASRYPVHVTVRVVDGLVSLRRLGRFKLVRRAILASTRADFRVTHFSVQSNHMHLIVEALDRRALARGMQGLQIRIARRLNPYLGRKGRLFSDRYHAHILKSPTEVRHALLYVLNNGRKHLAQVGQQPPAGLVDSYSSAIDFDGWCGPIRATTAPPDDAKPPAPRTWLLGVGWRRLGLLSPSAVPGRRRDTMVRSLV
jgi:REP element-mobilizing transposase RayT